MEKKNGTKSIEVFYLVDLMKTLFNLCWIYVEIWKNFNSHRFMSCFWWYQNTSNCRIHQPIPMLNVWIFQFLQLNLISIFVSFSLANINKNQTNIQHFDTIFFSFGSSGVCEMVALKHYDSMVDHEASCECVYEMLIKKHVDNLSGCNPITSASKNATCVSSLSLSLSVVIYGVKNICNTTIHKIDSMFFFSPNCPNFLLFFSKFYYYVYVWCAGRANAFWSVNSTYLYISFYRFAKLCKMKRKK